MIWFNDQEVSSIHVLIKLACLSLAKTHLENIVDKKQNKIQH